MEAAAQQSFPQKGLSADLPMTATAMIARGTMIIEITVSKVIAIILIMVVAVIIVIV